MKYQRLWFVLFVAAVFVPRLIVPDDFFIQDEQPWIDRSQVYTNALWKGDFAGAVEYPLSNHPAITLMTAVGPVMNWYGSHHGLEGTYAEWPLDAKRDGAVWARYIWGIVCSFVLLGLYATLRQLKAFSTRAWPAMLIVALFGLEPWIWGISRSVSVDVLMSIGVVGALVAAAVAREKQSWKWVALSGAWSALAFVSKSPALLTAPLAFLLAVWVMGLSWKELGRRAVAWVGGWYVAMVVLWPPFLIHPIQRLIDVLARAELHSTTPEHYLWPGVHPPLFIFTLSTFAFVGCVLYIFERGVGIKKEGWKFDAFDVLLFAGILHGAFLLYVQGDHARKNLPVLAMLAFVGVLGWLRLFERLKLKPLVAIPVLVILQALFVWPYFPHLISSYNVLFPSEDGKRLLIDVGNGSRVLADYINSQPAKEFWAIPVDSLVQPYLDADKRGRFTDMPQDGELNNLPDQTTRLVLPVSLPARVQFDADGRQLLKQVAGTQPITILKIRDVPLYMVYAIPLK